MKKYSEIMEELDYLITDAKIDNASDVLALKELIDLVKSTLLQRCMVEGMKKSSVFDDLKKKIDSLIEKYELEKVDIDCKMSNYTITFGSASLDIINEKIQRLLLIKDYLEINGLEEINKYCKYDRDKIESTKQKCAQPFLNPDNSNTKFFGKYIINSFGTYDCDTINRIFDLINCGINISEISKIITLYFEIEKIQEKLNQLSLAKQYSKELDLMRKYEQIVSNCDKSLVDNYPYYDDCRQKKEKYNGSRLYDLPILKIVKHKNNAKLNFFDYKNSMLYEKRTKAFYRRNVLHNKLMNIGLTEEMVNLFPYAYSVYGIDGIVENLNSTLVQKKKEYDNLYLSLDDSSKRHLDEEFETLSNIVSLITESQSSMINFYILYVLANLDNIILDYMNNNQIDIYKLSDVSKKISNRVEHEINNVINYTEKEKINS